MNFDFNNGRDGGAFDQNSSAGPSPLRGTNNGAFDVRPSERSSCAASNTGLSPTSSSFPGTGSSAGVSASDQQAAATGGGAEDPNLGGWYVDPTPRQASTFGTVINRLRENLRNPAPIVTTGGFSSSGSGATGGARVFEEDDLFQENNDDCTFQQQQFGGNSDGNQQDGLMVLPTDQDMRQRRVARQREGQTLAGMSENEIRGFFNQVEAEAQRRSWQQWGDGAEEEDDMIQQDTWEYEQDEHQRRHQSRRATAGNAALTEGDDLDYPLSHQLYETQIRSELSGPNNNSNNDGEDQPATAVNSQRFYTNGSSHGEEREDDEAPEINSGVRQRRDPSLVDIEDCHSPTSGPGGRWQNFNRRNGATPPPAGAEYYNAGGTQGTGWVVSRRAHRAQQLQHRRDQHNFLYVLREFAEKQVTSTVAATIRSLMRRYCSMLNETPMLTQFAEVRSSSGRPLLSRPPLLMTSTSTTAGGSDRYQCYPLGACEGSSKLGGNRKASPLVKSDKIEELDSSSEEEDANGRMVPKKKRKGPSMDQILLKHYDPATLARAKNFHDSHQEARQRRRKQHQVEDYPEMSIENSEESLGGGVDSPGAAGLPGQRGANKMPSRLLGAKREKVAITATGTFGTDAACFDGRSTKTTTTTTGGGSAPSGHQEPDTPNTSGLIDSLASFCLSDQLLPEAQNGTEDDDVRQSHPQKRRRIEPSLPILGASSSQIATEQDTEASGAGIQQNRGSFSTTEAVRIAKNKTEGNAKSQVSKSERVAGGKRERGNF